MVVSDHLHTFCYVAFLFFVQMLIRGREKTGTDFANAFSALVVALSNIPVFMVVRGICMARIEQAEARDESKRGRRKDLENASLGPEESQEMKVVMPSQALISRSAWAVAAHALEKFDPGVTDSSISLSRTTGSPVHSASAKSPPSDTMAKDSPASHDLPHPDKFNHLCVPEDHHETSTSFTRLMITTTRSRILCHFIAALGLSIALNVSTVFNPPNDVLLTAPKNTMECRNSTWRAELDLRDAACANKTYTGSLQCLQRFEKRLGFFY
jgi:hypothetical protein